MPLALAWTKIGKASDAGSITATRCNCAHTWMIFWIGCSDDHAALHTVMYLAAKYETVPLV